MSNFRMNQTPDIPANGNHIVITPHLHKQPHEKEYTVGLLENSADVLWQIAASTAFPLKAKEQMWTLTSIHSVMKKMHS